jgi:hypothetical protein
LAMASAQQEQSSVAAQLLAALVCVMVRSMHS